jgi:hypothetical protein
MFDGRSARLSPDGQLMAAIVGDAGPLEPDSTGTVVVLDTAADQVTPVTPPLLRRRDTSPGPRAAPSLFFSGYSYGAP